MGLFICYILTYPTILERGLGSRGLGFSFVRVYDLSEESRVLCKSSLRTAVGNEEELLRQRLEILIPKGLGIILKFGLWKNNGKENGNCYLRFMVFRA